MKIKKIVALIMFLCSAQLAKAQFVDLKGITIQATSKMFVENNEAKSEKLDQLFNVSFKDYILIHTIYTDGVVEQSQVYQLSAIDAFVDRDGVTIFKFNALSGLSGNTYKYLAKMGKDGILESFLLEDPTGYKTSYRGGITTLKTFKQQ
jgi:hypothetical protein